MNDSHIVRAIEQAEQAKGKPLHVVYDSVNDGLRLAGVTDPRATIAELVKAGKLYGRGCKGGYLVSCKPFASEPSAKAQAFAALLGSNRAEQAASMQPRLNRKGK